MSHWNYRVMRRCDEQHGETWLEIHEVHYDEAGSVTSWTDGATSVSGEDLAWVLARMNEALAKPVLDYETGKEV